MFRCRTPLLLLTGILLGSPAFAQPTDPFEAIVSDTAASAEAPLHDITVPAWDPSERELRQYLEALRCLNLSTQLTIDDGRGRSANVGAFEARNGTRVSIDAKWTRVGNEREAALRELTVVPTNPLKMGAFRFNRMHLDKNGVMHFKLNVNLMGIDFWPQELTVEKIYRDRSGNLVFKTGGSGLAGSFVPDFRVKPDGTLQRWNKGYWLFGWRNRGWKNVKEQGKTVKLPDTIPITRWPPGVTDVLEWMPEEGAVGSTVRDELGSLDTMLRAIPITNLSTRFEARGGGRNIVLDNGSKLRLKEHELKIVSNGRFRGRTYETDPTRENSFKATARLSGDLTEAGLGRANLRDGRLSLEGTHATTLPFEDLDRVRMDADYSGSFRGTLGRSRMNLADGGTLESRGGGRIESSGSGRVTIHPTRDGHDALELSVNPDNRYKVTINGPVDVAGISAPGGLIVPNLEIEGARGPNGKRKPVLVGEGTLGTNSGGHLTSRTDWTLEGRTAAPGMAYLLDAERSDVPNATLRIRRGARISGTAETVIDARSDLSRAGVRATADVSVSGVVEDATIRAGTTELDAPAADFEARAAFNSRYTTTGRTPLAIRRAAAEASITVRDGPGRYSVTFPDGAVLRGDINPGTRISGETGLLERPAGADHLETVGHARGERSARMNAHLVLGASSLAYRNLAVALDAETTVDLGLTLGFRVDPAELTPGGAPLGNDPIVMDMDLAVDVADGTFTYDKNGARSTTVRLRGDTRISAKTTVTVDPVTGAPQLGSLRGVDLRITAGAIDMRNILKPLGMNVSVNSRTTVRVRRATVEFRENGIRIKHRGITLNIAPGTINVRR